MFDLTRVKYIIEKNSPKTITVDIFDTIFLRKTYPEGLQFLKHAKNIQKLLQEAFGKHIDPMHWYSLRLTCRKQIDDHKQREKKDREANIEEIFSLIITSLEEQLNTILEHEEREILINNCIQKELDLEKERLRINAPLIKLLKDQKKSGTPLFFISDIYLSKEHINELLMHFNLQDLFQDGICSSEHEYNKGSYKLYKLINKKNLLPIEWLHNIHIGDNPTSDGLSAKRAGSLAFVLHQRHHLITRPIKKTLGSMLLKLKTWNSQRKLNKNFIQKRKQLFKNLSQPSQELARIGYTLGPALLSYLHFINLSSQYSNAPLCFLSSEGPSFEQYLQQLNARCIMKQLPTFNRLNTLKGFAHLSLTKPLIKYSPAIIQLFFHGEGKHSLKDLLKALGIKLHELGLTDLSLHHMPAEKFIKKLPKILKKQEHPHLKMTYLQLLKELQETHITAEKHIILADVGWNGTIQILLEQILQLLGKNTKTLGLYLGATGHNIFNLKRPNNIQGHIYPHLNHQLFQKALVEEVWEYILTSKEKTPQLKAIQGGLNTYFEQYKSNPSASPDWIFTSTKKHLQKLFHRPKRQQVLLLGALEHDAGFGSKKKRPIVDLQYTHFHIYKLLIFKPEQFKQIYLRQYWQRGFLKWYSLGYIQLFITGLTWFKKKNLEIFG